MAEAAANHSSPGLSQRALGQLRLEPEALTPTELRLACRCTFLLHPQLERFFVRALPRLLRHLRSVNERRQVDDRRVNGHVHWPATLKSRARGGPGRFVVRRAVRRYDLPENQLLALLLREVERGLHELPPALRAGWTYAGPDAPAVETLVRLSRLSTGLARAQRDPRLGAVSLPARVSASALLRARDTAMPEYAALAEVSVLGRALLELPSAEALKAASEEVILLPGEDGALLWARLALALSALSRRSP